jgi:hypothetical protein
MLYFEKQNALTQLNMRLPEVQRQLASVREENRRMHYEIDQFENPSHLLELAHRPEFSHLKHPLLREILTLPEAVATNY